MDRDRRDQFAALGQLGRDCHRDRLRCFYAEIFSVHESPYSTLRMPAEDRRIDAHDLVASRTFEGCEINR